LRDPWTVHGQAGQGINDRQHGRAANAALARQAPHLTGQRHSRMG
jgi:hypothetical protein